MSVPGLGPLVRSRLFLPALVFLSVNVFVSNILYHVNSFKIAVLGIGIALLAVLVDLFCPDKTEDKIPWKMLGWIALPVLATFPGYVWHGGAYNYNFAYELSAFLILGVWVLYLYRGIRCEEDLLPFFSIVGLTIFYVTIWAVLERIGYHPLVTEPLLDFRVKATFGNITYFAGFLIVLMPLFLVLGIPSAFFRTDPDPKQRSLFSAGHCFSLGVFGAALLSLLLTQTRAAMAAGAIALMVVVILLACHASSAVWRKRLWVLLGGGVAIGLLLVALLIVFREPLAGSRFTALFTLDAWFRRIVAWEAAVRSIAASPWIGYGLGSSYNLFFAFANPDARLYSVEHGYNHAHSEILEYVQEAGVLGLVVFLLFWGFLIYRLIRVLRSPSATPLTRKLVIGILGGFLGYHLHGLVDVAPRMMVVRLPLYTLLAIAFTIIFQSQPSLPSVAEKRPWGRRLMLFSPAFVLLAVFSVMYIPWAAGQAQYRQIRTEKPSLAEVEQLEAMVQRFPDIYALQDLTHLQLQYERFGPLEKTIQTIDRLIPGFRDLGHTKAMSAMLQKDYPRAIQQGLESQRRDSYFKPTIFLLIHLSLETGNLDLFWKQFQLWQRNLIYESKLDGGRRADQVIVRQAQMKEPLVIQEQDQSLVVTWNEKVVRDFFEASRAIKENPRDDQARRMLAGYLLYLFPSHPYFQLQIKEQYRATEAELIHKQVEGYFAAEGNRQMKSRELDQKQMERLYDLPPAEQRSLEKEIAREKERLLEPYTADMKRAEAYLIDKTDWKTFLQKRDFANRFIKEFLNR